jgi:beta-phosphoglucomutase family hydrolase
MMPPKMRQAAIQSLHTKLVEISPLKFQAVLFDMDGVVTKTATIHTMAWKEIFDEMLEEQFGSNFLPFSENDYLPYIDGKSREDGIRSFLLSRNTELMEGSSEDSPGLHSVCAVGELKDARFLELLHARGVEVYETTVALIRSLKLAGIKIATVTASKNGAEILHTANLAHMFDTKVDGLDSEHLGLHGKPCPDLFLEAARQLGVSPAHTVVIEDGTAGVEAGHRGEFGLVIGVARNGNFDLLKNHGADVVVVSDLAEVTLAGKVISAPGMVLAELKVSEENWIMSYDTFSPKSEQQRESLCALGNGYFCTRGAAPESHDDGVHYPGTYLAGGYNRVKLSNSNKQLEQEQLVNLPNWLAVSFKINGGKWFDLREVQILNFQQRLDLRQGLLHREFRFRSEEGKETSVSQRSFVHMRRQHMAGLEISWTAHNWSGELTVRSAIDGTVTNYSEQTGQTEAEKHFEYLKSTSNGGNLCLEVMTKQSRLMVAQAAKHTFFQDGREIDCKSLQIVDPGYVAKEVKFEIAENSQITLQKVVSLFTSRDRGISEPVQSALSAVANAPDFNSLVAEQSECWRHLWCQFDLFVDTTEAHSKTAPSLLLHLSTFHTLQTASPHTIDLDVGLPARGWTGEGYQGHVFWDALFVFPFINLRMPSISASLLKYRYRRLDTARAFAKSSGVSGARFPWQSGSDGRDETPAFDWSSKKQEWIPENSALEIHVNAAIAYDIWQYYQVTADLEFMNNYGAEMMFEIARFFASSAKYNSTSCRYEILGVVGPDEFHSAKPGSEIYGIDNNAYTNIMAVWTLSAALELKDILPSDHRDHLFERLKITDDEINHWNEVSRKMFVPLSEGIINQFEGFEKLTDFPRLEDGTLDMETLKLVLEQENGTPNGYKVCKQADVLLLFYVFSAEELKELFDRLGYNFESADIRKNIEYYLPITANGSTLSRLAHVWVLSRLDRRRSWNLLAGATSNSAPLTQDSETHDPHSWSVLMEALSSDYGDSHRDSARQGIHMGAMGGTLDIFQRCYTGLVIRKDTLWLSPQLPSALTRLSFSLRYRGQSLQFEITHETMKITALHSSALPVQIGFQENIFALNAGEQQCFVLKDQNIVSANFVQPTQKDVVA